MKKLGIFAVAALLAGMTMALLGSSALATIHPIVSSECAAQESHTTAGDFQDPPGQTPGDGPGDGKGDFKGVSNSDSNATKGQGTDNCKNP